ncbi:MAG TPA: hypoxanthine phosphoribosyltransferase [Tissierellaceae bacterium]
MKEEVLFTREDISKRVRELGEEITKDYDGKEILVISLLKGAFVFTADLVREINLPVEIDFLTTSSYGHGQESSGNVKFITDLTVEVKGKDVLIVDDIMDSGITMNEVKEYILSKNPNSVKVCTMLDKPSRRTVDLTPDYVGYEIPDVFIVGYGLNYEQYYRNTPYIFAFV